MRPSRATRNESPATSFRYCGAALLLLLVGKAYALQTICIDPGHPSEVGTGTRGKKLTEVGVAWSIGLALRDRLIRAGYRVVLTKAALNTKVTNRRRAEIANDASAELMVRLHCDSSNGTGFTVYYPAQLGHAQGVAGPSMNVLARSRTCAAAFHSAVASSLRGALIDSGLKTDRSTAIGSRQGALTASIFSKVPVLLVEMVVLTNPRDEAFIASALGQRQMTEALFRGVQAAVPRRTER